MEAVLDKRWRMLALRDRSMGTVSNRHLQRWLKTVVVSEVEKAPERRQVGIGETTGC